MQRPDQIKPESKPSKADTEFLNAVTDGKLMLSECTRCGGLFYRPTICPDCRATTFKWVKAQGEGKVFSFVLTYPGGKQGTGLPKAVIAVIELIEGPRFMAGLTGIAPRDVYVGLPVIVDFDAPEVSSDVAPFSFRPA